MLILNINKNECFISKNAFAEDEINDMFKEYFDELYCENAAKVRMEELWKKISFKIPRKAIFIEKDSILYTINSNLKFEKAPKDFFEIDECSHPALIDCFEECYVKFKKMIENYRNWSKKENNDSIYRVFLQNEYANDHKFADIEELKDNLAEVRNNLLSILGISLKAKISGQICNEIMELYKNELLKIEPIMLIAKTDFPLQKTYAVTTDLKVEEVTYSLIEREIEEIIYKVIPEDTDFLVNRIYNFIMLPLADIKPYIRINKLQTKGFNATMFLSEKNIPVVCYYSQLDRYYTFLKTKEKGTLGTEFPTYKIIRYLHDYMRTETMDPESGIHILREIDERMFDGIICYVRDDKWNMYFKLKDNSIEKIDKSNNIKAIKEEGTYVFWEITPKDE